jgi:hypothetical protein
MMEQHDEQHLSKQGRIVALVIAGSMLFWIAAQYIGPQIGLSGRFAILIDLLGTSRAVVGDGCNCTNLA